jgi:hypothetical protein
LHKAEIFPHRQPLKLVMFDKAENVFMKYFYAIGFGGRNVSPGK